MPSAPARQAAPAAILHSLCARRSAMRRAPRMFKVPRPAKIAPTPTMIAASRAGWALGLALLLSLM